METNTKHIKPLYEMLFSSKKLSLIMMQKFEVKSDKIT